MDIPTGLTAAKVALDMARALRDLDKALDQVALKSQIVDIMDRLSDVRSAFQDAQETLQAKDAEIAELKATMTARIKTIERNGFRYSIDPEDRDNPVGPPFCPRCDTADHKLMRLVNNNRGAGQICPQCKTEYGRGATVYLWPNQRMQR